MADVLYLCGLACLFTHELDAIQQEEWRFFLGWSPLSDEASYQLFTALHVPLFVWLVAMAYQPGLRLGVSVFMIAHMVAHIALRHHPAIRFTSLFSWLWIGGAGLCGVAYLFVVL